MSSRHWSDTAEHSIWSTSTCRQHSAFSPFCWFKKGSYQFLVKESALLRGLSLPMKMCGWSYPCHATPTSNFQSIRLLDPDDLYKVTYNNGKQCRSRSVGFFRSILGCFCKGRVYPGSTGQGLIVSNLTKYQQEVKRTPSGLSVPILRVNLVIMVISEDWLHAKSWLIKHCHSKA